MWVSTIISTPAANPLCLKKKCTFQYSSLFDFVDYIICFIAQVSNVDLGGLVIYFEREMKFNSLREFISLNFCLLCLERLLCNSII